MKLHKYKDTFESAIVAAAEHFGIFEVYLEKTTGARLFLNH
jgi:hypothetical protein